MKVWLQMLIIVVLGLVILPILPFLFILLIGGLGFAVIYYDIKVDSKNK